MSVKSPRRIALDALVRVDDGAYSNVLLPTMLRHSSLDARDRAFVTDLVYGTIRQQRALDYVLATAADRGLDALDPPVRAALRLGTYQLATGVPAHAAVGETVQAVAPRARGYVNAVLRKIAGLGPPWRYPDGDDPAALAIRLSYPDWIVEQLVAAFGMDDARAALVACNRPPRVTLRPNPRRTTSEALAGELRDAGIKADAGSLVASAVLVRGIGDPAGLPAVVEGRATPQDQASQAVVELLDPRPGEVVVDVAAAPGGKATAAGERIGGQGRVLAADIHPGRTRLVTRAASRLGVDNVLGVVADGRAPPTRVDRADRVLVDAPCTGLGVLRRRPEARWRVTEDDIQPLARLQRELLTAAAAVVRPGGVLVYSVCTLTRAETLGIDEWAVAELPGLVAESAPSAPWRPWGRGAVLLPHDADTDGMFVIRLRRT